MLNMFNISGRLPQPHAEQRGRRNELIVHFGETFGAISSSLASLGKSAIQILSALKVCCAASASCRARHRVSGDVGHDGEMRGVGLENEQPIDQCGCQPHQLQWRLPQMVKL